MFRFRLSIMAAAVILTAGATGAFAQNNQGDQPACSLSPSVVSNVLGKLTSVVQPPNNNGGLFTPNRMWAAVVDRQGVLCGVTRSDLDA